jgi:hypothetical protein
MNSSRFEMTVHSEEQKSLSGNFITINVLQATSRFLVHSIVSSQYLNLPSKPLRPIQALK